MGFRKLHSSLELPQSDISVANTSPHEINLQKIFVQSGMAA